jgi:hypothetical protein
MKIFSLPLNPKLNQSQFNELIGFLTQYKDYIYDVYFTSRIAPFNQDAMGDVFILHEESAISCIDAALHIQNTLGITVSATFNNIHVSPDQKNLDLFIKNFRPLYDAGIHSATIPHTQWLLTGKLQAEFPELHIKNTILRDVNRANQVYEAAKAGFHYINLDRDLMRDRDELEKIKRVKEHFPGLKISLLTNEGCLGNCPIMPEHYQYNCTRTASEPQYFTSSIARISCQKWDVEDPAVMLKTANLPPWREDWDELRELGIDTFKMHGRENIDKLGESIRIIIRYAAGDAILFDNFEEYIESTNLDKKPIDAWRKIIKNCKFDCWDCGYCDKVYDKKSDIQQDDKVLQVVDIVAFHDNLELSEVDIQGLTSQRVRKLLYELGAISNNYLEIGCFHGATGTAVLDSDIATAYFVDHWQENIQPDNGSLLPENSKQVFINNAKAHKKSTDIKLFDCDLFAVDITEISDVDLFFYDGPHDAETTAKAVVYYAHSLSDRAVVVFDDANWDGVVDGARAGIAQAGLTILYDKILLCDQESTDEWWNGLYIVVVSKTTF